MKVTRSDCRWQTDTYGFGWQKKFIPKNFYFYDLLTGETIDITDKAKEYNIISYDGYNKVFIIYDGEYKVIKKERVLGK